MPWERVTWAFAALFLIFGLPLFFVEGADARRFLTGASVISLGCFALAMAGGGIARGRIRFQFSWIERNRRPVLFWLSILVVAGAGIGSITAGIWALFFKEV